MPIESSGAKATANVSVVKARAAVAVVAPGASVVTVVPVAGIQYIELALRAAVDTTGRYRYITEAFAVVDGVSLLLAKAQDDSVGTTDNSFRSFGKNLVDVATMSDLLTTTLIFIRELSETVAANDALAKTLAKAAVDSVVSSDAYALTVARNDADSIAVAEAATLSVAKALVDSFATADAAARSTDKVLTDAQALADLAVLSVAKAVSDTATPADAIAFDQSRVLADGFGLNESLQFNYSLANTIDNVSFATDSTALSSSKALSDSVALAESGLIAVQNYCDLTYFAQDYVGITQSF